MSDREELAKGVDAVVIALGDISKRLKEAPVELEKKHVCPACGAEHQSNTTKVMHIASKHPEWVVIRNPSEQMAVEVVGELEPLKRPVPVLPVKKHVERDWSKVALGVVVVGVVLIVAAAFLL